MKQHVNDTRRQLRTLFHKVILVLVQVLILIVDLSLNIDEPVALLLLVGLRWQAFASVVLDVRMVRCPSSLVHSFSPVRDETHSSPASRVLALVLFVVLVLVIFIFVILIIIVVIIVIVVPLEGRGRWDHAAGGSQHMSTLSRFLASDRALDTKHGQVI